jgi:hypothetical protein
MIKRESGSKARSSANDNANVNPINGPIAQSKPNRQAWSGIMDAIASGSFETNNQRVKNIQEGARAAVKYGVSKTYKDGVSKSKANLDGMLKPYRKKK